MKHFCFLLIFAMTAVLSAAAKPAAATPAQPADAAKPAAATPAQPADAAKPAATPTAKSAETTKPAAATVKSAGSVLSTIYTANHDPTEFADREKAEDLLNRRTVLVQKIQDERKRLLKEDDAARKLYEEIMLLNRRLASLLETKKTMIELDSQLRELDSVISKLKPAPPPEAETKDAEKEDADKADTVDKAKKE